MLFLKQFIIQHILINLQPFRDRKLGLRLGLGIGLGLGWIGTTQC